MQALNVGLENALNVSGVTTLATGGIHNMLAPPGTLYPFVIFQLVTGTPARAFGGGIAYRDFIYMVKALAQDTATDSGIEIADKIMDAVMTAIDNQILTVSGFRNMVCWKVRDIPDFMQNDEGNTYFTKGAQFQITLGN